MSATVSITAPLKRQVATALTPKLVPVTIAANSVSYTTTAGGLAFDLFTFLADAKSTNGVPLDANDILGFLPKGVTSPNKYLPIGLTMGTITDTTVPCLIKLLGTGSTTAAGYSEVADGACTESITGWVVIAA